MFGQSAFELGIDLDVWPWIWLGTAVVFSLIELTVLGGSFVLLPFAVSAFAATLLAFAEVSVAVQWLVFVVGGAVLFGVAVRWARRYLDDSAKPLGVGADRLVGMTALVTEPIAPGETDRAGRVTVAGEIWGAVTDSGGTIERGRMVRILAMRGTRVVVDPQTPSTPEDGKSS